MDRTFSFIKGVLDKKPAPLGKDEFHLICQSDQVHRLVERYQNGDAEAKKKLPAVMWLGTPQNGTRKQEDCLPTQLYLIDIDHISETPHQLPQGGGTNADGGKTDYSPLGESEGGRWTPVNVWECIRQSMGAMDYDFKIRLVHVTPSGDGLRMVLYATENFPTLKEHAEWLCKKLALDQYGTFDYLKDYSRISFLVPEDYILLESPYLWEEIEDFAPLLPVGETKRASGTTKRGKATTIQPAAYDTEQGSYEPVMFQGFKIQDVIDRRYRNGLPGTNGSSRHDQSLILARDLLVIFDRDEALVRQVLTEQPWVKAIMEERNEDVDATIESAKKYAQSKDGTWSLTYASVSPAMSNALKFVTGKTWKAWRELINKPFEEELEEDDTTPSDSPEGGGWNGDDDGNCELRTMNSELKKMPTPPPVLRELVSIAPDDFKIPTINALLPVLGTLTSYVRAEDRQQNKTLSTSFFSIIYAPPSSGKSFVERYVNYLLRDIMLRDEINEAKDAVFARTQQTKSANDRSEAVPQTSVRIMEAKNSEAEFLEKQRANAGHHMFTYCSEIDQWRKGIRAAGGNKDDMVRIAWDNGKYGQNFKSSNTFKGKVNLYWNVLIAGTSDQLAVYFSNVTNGLVTRCSFQEIKNQEFQKKPAVWKSLGKKERKVVDAFIEKCDAMTYSEPLSYNPADCYSVADKDFDSEVPWKFTFKPLTYVDIDWIIPTINKFNARQCDIAIRNQDVARDTFRRRVGERGKRLAMMCTQFYSKPMTDKDKKACAKWIEWWMEQDIEGIMQPFGAKYVEALQVAEVGKPKLFSSLYDLIPETFTKNDITVRARQCNVFTNARNIIYRWVEAGYAVKSSAYEWKKTNKK